MLALIDTNRTSRADEEQTRVVIYMFDGKGDEILVNTNIGKIDGDMKHGWWLMGGDAKTFEREKQLMEKIEKAG